MQAEAITAAITGVLKDSLENASQSFLSKEEMQKVRHFDIMDVLFANITPCVSSLI